MSDETGSRAPAPSPGPGLRATFAVARGIDRLNEWAGWISQWFVVLTIVVGIINTTLRYIGQNIGQQLTSNVWLELQWNLYSVIFLLGFGYIMKHGVNVRVDFWYANQERRRKLWIDLVGHVVSMIPFTLIGIWISRTAVTLSWSIREVSPNAGGLPIYPIKTMILVALVLLFLQTVSEIIKIVGELRGYDMGVEITDAPLRVE